MGFTLHFNAIMDWWDDPGTIPPSTPPESVSSVQVMKPRHMLNTDQLNDPGSIMFWAIVPVAHFPKDYLTASNGLGSVFKLHEVPNRYYVTRRIHPLMSNGELIGWQCLCHDSTYLGR